MRRLRPVKRTVPCAPWTRARGLEASARLIRRRRLGQNKLAPVSTSTRTARAMTWGSSTRAILELREPPGAVVVDGLAQLVLGVHDEGAVARDRLADGAAREREQSRARRRTRHELLALAQHGQLAGGDLRAVRAQL